MLRVTFCVVITGYLVVKAQQYFVTSSCMLLEEKTVLENWLNPGLNLTIFEGTGPWVLIWLPACRRFLFSLLLAAKEIGDVCTQAIIWVCEQFYDAKCWLGQLQTPWQHSKVRLYWSPWREEKSFGKLKCWKSPIRACVKPCLWPFWSLSERKDLHEIIVTLFCLRFSRYDTCLQMSRATPNNLIG